ncbi:predicted protein [Streptomyces pristinaespiralis ATCC 25486]|uniref:Predicted protein n=1 Tax=Streptomyces pristinaespiralis (strain ATCC 25486 / DSM 40338 / CBS 914.69 / JCM 4507 / KCC S-0507 / NBRC 13074 / NRRL 2958 / 5647) TaxID=457429 RepID=D6X7U7_STRE2|nr:predicted protein [Streptomyces pristinaespiralis ATCC 25486]
MRRAASGPTGGERAQVLPQKLDVFFPLDVVFPSVSWSIGGRVPVPRAVKRHGPGGGGRCGTPRPLS